MTTESQAIEVEVVEIDRTTPPAKFDRREDRPPRRPWQNWQGQVRTLDSRWWPLWLVLGAIAILLMLTVGLFLGIIFLIFRILRGILRAIFR